MLAMIGFYRRWISPMLGPAVVLFPPAAPTEWKRFSAMVHGVVAGSPCVGSAGAIPSPPAAVTPSPTEPLLLTLFSRQGCCLCEGLEQRLRQLDSAVAPSSQLTVIDIDAPGIDPDCGRATTSRCRFCISRTFPYPGSRRG